MTVAYRQSLLRVYDRCPLAAKWEIESTVEYHTPEQALGTLFHGVIHEMLQTMRRVGAKRIPTEEALVIMYEVAAREDMPHVSDGDLRDLRWMILQFCGYEWDSSRFVGLEEQLSTDIVCEDGITRTLTGRPDTAIADPPEGLIVVDYKSGKGKPPKPRHPEIREEWERDDGKPFLSERGVFQLDTYGLLEMDNRPTVKYVLLREFHARSGEMRDAVLRRDELEHVRRRLGVLLMRLDMVATGQSEPHPQPGAWCRKACPRPSQCTIPAEERRAGQIVSVATALSVAARYTVSAAQTSRDADSLKAYLDATAQQVIPIYSSFVGWKESPGSAQVLTVHERHACPKCDAPVGAMCIRPRKGGYESAAVPLMNPHAERIALDGVDLRLSRRSFGVHESDPTITTPQGDSDD